MLVVSCSCKNIFGFEILWVMRYLDTSMMCWVIISGFGIWTTLRAWNMEHGTYNSMELHLSIFLTWLSVLALRRARKISWQQQALFTFYAILQYRYCCCRGGGWLNGANCCCYCVGKKKYCSARNQFLVQIVVFPKEIAKCLCAPHNCTLLKQAADAPIDTGTSKPSPKCGSIHSFIRLLAPFLDWHRHDVTNIVAARFSRINNSQAGRSLPRCCARTH